MSYGGISKEAFTDQVCIVTGAASGIGFATAKAFLAANARGVVLVDLSAEALSAAVKRLSDAIGSDIAERTATFAGDVSVEGTAEGYVAEARKKFGRVDVSVQCAGISLPPADLVDLEVADWDKTIGVNLRGVFLGMQQSIKGILESSGSIKERRGGAIVLVSSQLGLDGKSTPRTPNFDRYPGSAAYSASKFAVRGLMTSVAQEVGPKGIRVNAVCPGPIETPMLEGFTAEGHLTRGNIKRAGKPEEVADAILFLASEASSYMSGSTVKVDGGWSKWC
ncbi:hypothetical protein JCM8202v2_002417 [Rhodotorula sphaerocarpa]